MVLWSQRLLPGLVLRKQRPALQVLNVARLAGNLQEQGEQTRQQAATLAVRLQVLEHAHGAPCGVRDPRALAPAG